LIRLDHLVLRVSDFESAANFYCMLFKFAGFDEVQDVGSSRSIGFRSEGGLTIWLEEVKGLKAGEGVGWLDHYALHCESREEVLRAYDFCKEQKWVIIAEPKGYPEYGDFYGFSFHGPDNIKLEFVTR